jgi:arsenate reductase (thioredoxin)
MSEKLKIAFVCTGNSCRSQIAEGWANHLGSDCFEAYSAGTHPADKVNDNAVEVMRESGIDISGQRPKLILDLPEGMDIVIKMGCGVECPFLPAGYEEDWGLEDPVGKPMDAFRETSRLVREKMNDIIEKVKSGEIRKYEQE